MKKTLIQWMAVCCMAVCACGLVSMAGCGGPSSTPTGVDAPPDEPETEEYQQGEMGAVESGEAEDE